MTILPALQRCIGGFVRRTWLVTLVAVVVCAGFAARAVAAYVDADLQVAPHAPPSKAPPRVSVSPPPARDPNVLVQRNIFCSSCTPVVGPGPSNAYSGQPAVLIATSLGDQPRATLRVIPTEAQ